jgi:hypothetical protein
MAISLISKDFMYKEGKKSNSPIPMSVDSEIIILLQIITVPIKREFLNSLQHLLKEVD